MTRPFRGLDPTLGPEAYYDVVVIGAGIAGLICASLMAKRGMKVLVCERHTMVGGYCSTFRRRGFVFDAASHFYPLLGNAETITGNLLKELEIQTGWVKMDPVDHFHLPDGTTFRVPADFEAYRDLLDREFPHERKNLSAFFEAVRRAYMAGLLLYFRETPSRLAAEWAGLSLRDMLDRHFTDPRLKLVLAADGPHWGAPPSRTSFLFDSMLRLSYFLGNYYPVGGSQAFADALAARFEGLGGHLAMKADVVRIALEQGRVSGVVLETGRNRLRRCFEVKAPLVIAAGDLRDCVNRLIGRETFQAEYLARLDELKPSYACYLMHLGLRGVSRERLEEIQGYHWAGWDSERMGQDSLKFKLFVPTQFEPRMAPPGGEVLIVQKVLEFAYEAVADWQAHKAEVDSFVWTELRRLAPELEAATVTWSSASALTSQRYTGNYQGAMLGWEMSPEQLGTARPAQQAPIEGLYLTGHWTQPGGGITPVIVSAMRVAEAVLGVRARSTEALHDASFVAPRRLRGVAS